MLDTTRQDLRFAFRTLRHSPGFTFAALLTLALGIGANTAIFSVIDAALLHPIPFPDAERLVTLYATSKSESKNSISYPNLLDWQKQAQTAEISGVRNDDTYTMSGRGEPEQVMALAVSSNLLAVLGVQPLLGRMFTAQEDMRGGAAVLLLGENFWRRRFAADPKIVGQTLRLNGRDYAVIGVVPARVAKLRFDDSPGPAKDVITPIGQSNAEIYYDRGVGDSTTGLGRLKAGATLAQARAEMKAIARGLEQEFPDKDKDTGANVMQYRQDLTGGLRPVLLALIASVGFVLLIACTNVANLVLARSAGRAQEFGVRMALGAGPGRLVRQMLTESVMLALAGGALGLLIASWCTGAALAVLPSVLPGTVDVEVNPRVLLFTLAVSLVTGMLFGCAPALKVREANLQETLRQGARGVLSGRRKPQYLLIIAEVALTLVLLTGTGLLYRTLHNLWSVAPGFQPNHLLVFYSSLSPERSSSPAAARAALEEWNRRLRAIPGVEAAGVEAGGLPFIGNTGVGFNRADQPPPADGSHRLSNIYWVSPDHFQAMGIPLLRGRAFSEGDTQGRPLVAVIDEDSARAVFQGEDPIGKQLHVWLHDRPVEIVGIAGRVKQARLDPDAESNQYAQLYIPIGQMPDSIVPMMANAFASLVRSKTEPAALLRELRKEVNSFDGGAVFGEQWMTDNIAASLAPRRFSLIVLGCFAGIALLLSITGIYGVVSYLIGQRTNEIGVRMTMGARPNDIFLDVLREGAIVGGIGVGLGLIGAALLTRLMSSLLFQVSSTDLLTFLAAAVLLFACTLAACYAPARRAVRVDPATALRCG